MQQIPQGGPGAVEQTGAVSRGGPRGGAWDATVDDPRTDLPLASAGLRHDRMGQGPTEPHAGRSTFLLSSGGAGGGSY